MFFTESAQSVILCQGVSVVFSSIWDRPKTTKTLKKQKCKIILLQESHNSKVTNEEHKMATIALFSVKDWEQKYLKAKLGKHKTIFFKECLSKDHLAKLKDVEVLSLFVDSKLTHEDLRSLPKLKLVALRSTGFDHVDIKACAEKKIAVCTVPFYGENTVAEHAFALLLALSRKIPETYNRTHTFKDMTYDGLTGFDLRGKTMGLIGGGNIGMHAAKIAHGFGMRILVADPFQKPLLPEVLGFEYVPLDQLLKESDVISVHAPYNEHTHHIINEKNIKLIKKGCVFINTSRGGLIDTYALLKALQNGTIVAAGIDVIEDEQLVMNPPQKLTAEEVKRQKRNREIIKMDNVIFTPHNAFNSIEALRRILDTTASNIDTGLVGKFQNKVN
jgi:D-lactate dehydrogenase